MNNEINGIMDQALNGIGRQDVTQFRNIVDEKRFDSNNIFTNSFVTPIVSSEYSFGLVTWFNNLIIN